MFQRRHVAPKVGQSTLARGRHASGPRPGSSGSTAIWLLQGLRVALPGVQVLFGFLLILPFQSQFPEVTEFQEKVYFGTLMCVAIASVLLIAPTARHRIRFRQDDKEYVVFSANRLAIAGLGFLGLGFSGAILLVSDFLFGAAVAIAATATVAVSLAWVWFGSPVLRRLRDPD